jgi:hypothetical protein
MGMRLAFFAAGVLLVWLVMVTTGSAQDRLEARVNSIRTAAAGVRVEHRSPLHVP